MKVTIRPYNALDEPDPPFRATSLETIQHVRVSVFHEKNQVMNLHWLTGLFQRLVTSIQNSSHNKILVKHETQIKENRFCQDFHLDDNNSDKVKAFMQFVYQELSRENWLKVSIKPRSSNCLFKYSSI